VQKRIRELDAADAKKPKDKVTNLPARTDWRLTEWSEPSPVAALPPLSRVLATKVSPKAPQKVTISTPSGPKPIDVNVIEPTATTLAVVFDPAKAADVPAENDKILRGSVVNFSAEKVKVIHPVTADRRFV
jgi:hypothetical protein